MEELIFKAAGVALGVSGWAKVVIDHYSSKPKFSGQLLNVIRSQMNINGAVQSAFIAYPYIHNLRKNSMHILDYEMSIKVDGKWIELALSYGLEHVRTINFTSPAGNALIIPDFPDKLIHRKEEGVQHGVPLHGFIVFVGDVSLYQVKIDEYKLVCIDVNRKRHTILTKPTEMRDHLMIQFSGMVPPDDMMVR